MKRTVLGTLAGVCALVVAAGWAAPARAQMMSNDVKEKPPMYSYVGLWNFERSHWGDVAKDNANDEKVLQKAMSDGSIVGYGNDTNLVHTMDGTTHDQWWSSMSMAGMLNVLDTFYKNGSATSALNTGAKGHMDEIFMSRYYDYKPGSYKGAYTRVAVYKFRQDAPPDALEMASKNLFVPLLGKLLADGTIVEYEVDTQAIHSESPDFFWVVFITPTSDGLDKFNMALHEALKMNPMGAPAFDSMVDMSAHRDYLDRTDATYK